MNRILIVDDEPDMLTTCKAALSMKGVSVVLEGMAPHALERLKEGFDLVVTDVKMPGLNGIDLLKAAKEVDSELPVILMTAYPEVESAVEALRVGALDYLIKPFHPEDLKIKVLRALKERRLKEENRLLARQMGRDYISLEMIGQSAAMRKTLEWADKIAPTPTDVLILGESGTGKELVARRLHTRSGRTGPFVPVDCGAIPENLLENELFGHERGAFTDASSTTPGLLEFAHLGTFFMDEVCELPLSVQAKLLRTVQERQFRRVGGKETIGVDVRVVAATNKDIQKEVQEGRFRKDLYYRLNVVTVTLPPLRERPDDIRPLVDYFFPRYCKELRKTVSHVEKEVYEILLNYFWPGNIRELQNVLKKSIVACDGPTLTATDLPRLVIEAPLSDGGREGGFTDLKKRQSLTFEKEYFETLLRRHNGNAKAAAETAGLPLSNLYWYLKKHQIKPDQF